MGLISMPTVWSSWSGKLLSFANVNFTGDPLPVPLSSAFKMLDAHTLVELSIAP